MSSYKSIIKELLETVAVSSIVILVIYLFIASVEVVDGSSMEPNFHTGDRIMVDKTSVRLRAYTRAEVVVITPPGNEDKHYLKRVIGLPGDIVKILDCQVYISRDGKKYVLEEAYLTAGMCTSAGNIAQEGRSLRIPNDYYLVLGDNRPYSVDSRYFGLVSKDKILGRVIFRFWPLGHLGFIY